MSTCNSALFLTTYYILNFCFAQATAKCEDPKWRWGRFFVYGSNKTSISDAVKSAKDWNKAASKIIEFAEVIGQKRKDDNAFLRCLNHDSLAMERELPSANTTMKRLGFGTLDKCVVDIEWDFGLRLKGQSMAKEIFPYMDLFDRKLTSSATAKIVQGYIGVQKKNWDSLHSISKSQFNGALGVRVCKLFRLVTYRNNSEWKINAAFTNTNGEIEQPDYQRWYGEEILEFSGSILKSSREISVNGCDISGKPEPIRNGTLSVLKWSGQVSSHAFITERLEDNRAIQKAIDSTNLFTEIVVESNLASSIAVLFLPSVLALFPASLFQEASLTTGFVYSVATDVLSITPVIIKGIELITFGSNIYWSIYTRFYGGADKDKPAVALHWISNCAMKPQIRAQGAGYLFVGLGLMLLGLILEIMAARKLQSLKTEWCQENTDNPQIAINQNAGLLWHWRQMRSRRAFIERETTSYLQDLSDES